MARWVDRYTESTASTDIAKYTDLDYLEIGGVNAAVFTRKAVNFGEGFFSVFFDTHRTQH